MLTWLEEGIQAENDAAGPLKGMTKIETVSGVPGATIMSNWARLDGDGANLGLDFIEFGWGAEQDQGQDQLHERCAWVTKDIGRGVALKLSTATLTLNTNSVRWEVM